MCVCVLTYIVVKYIYVSLLANPIFISPSSAFEISFLSFQCMDKYHAKTDIVVNNLAFMIIICKNIWKLEVSDFLKF